MLQDLLYIFQWWAVLFGIGIIYLPLTKLLFPTFKDSFYIFSKVLGIGILSYALLLFGTLHILPFSTISIVALLAISLITNAYILKKVLIPQKKKLSKIIIFEEILFFTCIVVWSFIRGFEPNINGLEKFMDFGFVNSILRTTYFPPQDMWFTPFSINYYFFGHLITAMLTKLSGINPAITYNLMMATLFAFCAIGGFSLVFNFLSEKGMKRAITGGILGGLLISLSGNLHTLYSFFQSYTGENPVPLWTLDFLPNLFPNGYWYPNATRFIPYTIHEFPLYSFVVSDLHGHVLDIPFVLLTIGLLYSIIKDAKVTKIKITILSLLLSIMYMTNVWDSAIYMMLFFLVLLFVLKNKLHITFYKQKYAGILPKIKTLGHIKEYLITYITTAGIAVILFVAFTLPFSLHFKPFVSGIGIVCPPEFLTNIEIHKDTTGEFILGKIGPFLFEKDHCQRSPIYQLVTLYGFFLFFVVVFMFVVLKRIKSKAVDIGEQATNIFVFLLILLSILLIAAPEFIYAKDIYPQHYRANTMFKLVYQSFMMLSLVSAYVIIYVLSLPTKSKPKLIFKACFACISTILVFLVLLYSYFAIPSYYGGLAFNKDESFIEHIKTLPDSYKGLQGIDYLQTHRPGDYETIQFINSTISNQPVILEAQGDSYTDFARVSAYTGLPTVLGWTVHEWLWRGSYDIPSPRIDEVKKLYEGSASETKTLLKKYAIEYVYVGTLEREKYPLLNEQKFEELGEEIFRSTDNTTVLYKITK